MRYQVLQDFCLGSALDVKAGEVVELLPTDAVGYVQSGRLLAIEDAQAPEGSEVTAPAAPSAPEPEQSFPNSGDPNAPNVEPPLPEVNQTQIPGVTQP